MKRKYVAYSCRRLGEAEPFGLYLDLGQKTIANVSSCSLKDLGYLWAQRGPIQSGDVLTTRSAAETHETERDIEEPLTGDQLIQLRLLREVYRGRMEKIRTDAAQDILRERWGLHSSSL